MSKEREYHGLYNHPLYRRWHNINNRCNNKKFPYYIDYGGRGITMCDEWKNSFKAFYDYITSLPDYDLKLTLDRIDNDGNYEPGNIRWAGMHIQTKNSRKRKNKLGFEGIRKTANNKYNARITINYKEKHIGNFDTPEQASKARIKYILDNNLIEYL